jgi:hypothetical protein
MGKLRFIFFDVGNTLLFPNRAKILEPLPDGKHATLEDWHAFTTAHKAGVRSGADEWEDGS